MFWELHKNYFDFYFIFIFILFLSLFYVDFCFILILFYFHLNFRDFYFRFLECFLCGYWVPFLSQVSSYETVQQ